MDSESHISLVTTLFLAATAADQITLVDEVGQGLELRYDVDHVVFDGSTLLLNCDGEQMQVSANDQPVELNEKGFGTFTDCEGNKMGVYFERKLVRAITAADIAKAQTTEAVPA